jgi:hypothetical protein
MRITSGGNLIVGTMTDNGSRFQVSGAATFSSSVTATNAVFDRVANDSGSILRIGNATTYYDFSRNASTGALSIQGNQTGANNIIIAPTSGNLLVGTTTDVGVKVNISGNVNISSGSFYVYNGDNYIGSASSITGGTSNQLGIRASTDLLFATNGSNERLRITSGGNLLVGTTTDIASSKVTISSTTQGFLPPRMTTTQKNAIGTPAAGLIVYDTDTNKLCCYNGSTWNDLF